MEKKSKGSFLRRRGGGAGSAVKRTLAWKLTNSGNTTTKITFKNWKRFITYAPCATRLSILGSGAIPRREEDNWRTQD